MVTRLLVVEDHPLFAEAICGVLLSAIKGVDVICATTLNEAKELLDKDRRFDLVLLDLWLPDTHGFGGLIELRRCYPKLPIVVVSAFADPNSPANPTPSTNEAPASSANAQAS